MPSPLDTIPQTTQDFALLKHLLYQTILEGHYRTVVEVGTDVGDSTRVFSTALQATQGSLVTIDAKPPVQDWPKDWPIKNIQVVTQPSQQVSLKEPIDLLFLDGDHTKEAVAQELRQLGVWVKVGGKILLHDVFHQQYGEGIRAAVQEFCVAQQLAWTLYPQQHGLAIVEVSHQLPR